MDRAPDRLNWFHEAKVGLFIHWGCYAALGRGEQVLEREHIPLATYRRVAADWRASGCDPQEWVDCALGMGARYIVFPTRHHDAYCLWRTQTTDWNSVEVGPGRDFVAECCAAARAAGLKVGLYYSIADWTNPAYWEPEQHAEHLPHLVDRVHEQVRELLSNYGRIDMLWYDRGGVPGRESGKPLAMSGSGFYRSVELRDLARSLQPEILINNRSGIDCDFTTPEQRVEPAGPGEAWETCYKMTPGPGWGYLHHDPLMHAPDVLLYELVDAVRQGGNFLLNISPDGQGRIASGEYERLRRIGQWLQTHGAAIYGTRPTGLQGASMGNAYGLGQQQGVWTGRGTSTWYTVFRWQAPFLVVPSISGSPTGARILADGHPVRARVIGDTLVLDELPALPMGSPFPVIQVDWQAPPRYSAPDDHAAWLASESPVDYAT